MFKLLFLRSFSTSRAESRSNLTEKVDIPVRNAKAEFIEIVQISADKYYEQVLTDVTWEQKQHDRTDETGVYLLDGLTPGTYIVRFTYGDTVDEKEDGVEELEPVITSKWRIMLWHMVRLLQNRKKF